MCIGKCQTRKYRRDLLYCCCIWGSRYAVAYLSVGGFGTPLWAYDIELTLYHMTYDSFVLDIIHGKDPSWHLSRNINWTEVPIKAIPRGCAESLETSNRTRNPHRSITAWEGLKASTPRASFPKLMQFHSSFIDGAAGINPYAKGASHRYDDFLLTLLPNLGLQWA